MASDYPYCGVGKKLQRIPIRASPRYGCRHPSDDPFRLDGHAVFKEESPCLPLIPLSPLSVSTKPISKASPRFTTTRRSLAKCCKCRFSPLKSGMGVAVAWQGQGVGSRLLAAVLDLADNWMNVQRVELSVYADNEAAIALYRKFGFDTEGLFREYAVRDGALVDALSMARLRRLLKAG
jgi:GNAT superfamily N-acetyltransferase